MRVRSDMGQFARKALISMVLLAGPVFPQATGVPRARQLYEKTRYEDALALLSGMATENGAVYSLMGECHYMLGDFGKASEALERAVRLEPNNSEYHLWLGRAYGRRAETSTFFTAPGLASKARDHFERAFALNNSNLEATGDLFEYYLEAPSFLGGGVPKAAALAEKTKNLDLAEYHYRLGRIADSKKEYKDAEEQFRRAMDLAPRQVGRVVDLANYLSRQGKYQESEAVFSLAEDIDPNNPKVMFERAKAYIQSKRNRYLNSPLSPNDPSRREAEQLLKQARTS